MTRHSPTLQAIAVLALAAALGWSPAAAAQNGEGAASALAPLYQCAAVEADAERLACYDAAAGRLKDAEAAGEVAAVTRAEVETLQNDAFGFSIPALSMPSLSLPELGGGPEAIESGVTAALAGRGGVIVKLENGQIWRQTGTKRVRLPRRGTPERASIRKAALGSFMMQLDDGPLFRVERVE